MIMTVAETTGGQHLTVGIQNGEKIMTNFIRNAGAALAFAGLAVSGAVADTSHTTKVACYASVQTQCYGNGETNCTEEEYQEGLGWCDQYYEIALPDPQGVVTDVKATPKPTSTPLVVRKSR